MRILPLDIFGRHCSLTLLVATSFCAQAQSPCGQAEVLHKQGQISAAIPKYEACLKLEPGNVQSRSNLGAALAHEGRYSEAIEQDRAALRDAPASMMGALELNLALAFYKSARFSEAAAEFGEVLNQDRTNRRAAILLAECDLMLDAPAKAVSLLEPLERAFPDDLAVLFLLGSALLRSGNVQNGQRMLDRILRDGESAQGHMLLGVTMFQAGNYPEAVREFQKTESLNSTLPSLHSYFGRALLNTGDADAAASAFLRELEANGADFESNLRLGQIHLARKQFGMALPFLEHALQVRPSSEEARVSVSDARNHRVAVPQGGADGPPVGSLAPPFTLKSARKGKSESLAELHRSGPVVVVFGSYTCPQFRAAVPALNELHAKFGNRVSFALIYVSEAHGEGAWQSTINQRDAVDLPTERNAHEKEDHAVLCLRKLSIPYQAFVDTMDRATEKAYSAWPSRVYLIDLDGRIRFQTRLNELEFDRSALDHVIAGLLGTR